MKRFYKAVSVGKADAGHRVLLDGRAVSTPAKRKLDVPGEALAEAIAEEWRGQESEIRPQAMPLTQLACTALDHVAPQRGQIVEETAAFGANDLLCYRVERPAALRDRQDREWQPLLDWAAEAYGARLRVTSGLMAVDQPCESVAALSTAVAALEDFPLTALANAVRLTGSLVLGLALLRGRLDPHRAFQAAELDETFQMELWGEDSLALARRDARLSDLSATGLFLRLLDGQSPVPRPVDGGGAH